MFIWNIIITAGTCGVKFQEVQVNIAYFLVSFEVVDGKERIESNQINCALYRLLQIYQLDNKSPTFENQEHSNIHTDLKENWTNSYLLHMCTVYDAGQHEHSYHYHLIISQ